MRTRRMRAAAVLTAAGVLLAAGCSSGPETGDQGPDPSTASATVVVRDMSFSPHKVTVKAGQSVTWKFDDGDVRHDVTADDGSFESETAVSGHYTHEFDDPGKYSYACSIHPVMTGTVIVTPKG